MNKADKLLESCPRAAVKKSAILSSNIFASTYDQFGIDGIKSYILQELAKLENDRILKEIEFLAMAAKDCREIKRALRATKLLAMQWMEDKRREPVSKERSKIIFDAIPTFGMAIMTGPPVVEIQAAPPEPVPVPHEYPGPPFKLDAENKVVLDKGDILLYITDIQGNYQLLEDNLLTYRFADKSDSGIRWIASSNKRVVIIGNLFNSSPYSIWHEPVYMDSFKLIATLRSLSIQSGGNVVFSFGDYDMEVASKSIFLNPSFNFTSKMGVYTQAQALPILISFLKETAFADENNDYCAWQAILSGNLEQCFILKDSFKINGNPEIIIPANVHGLPDVKPLIEFLEKLYKFVAPPSRAHMPQSAEDVDNIASQIIPETEITLDISALVSSENRAYLLEGLLDGTGTTDFLRQNIAALNVFQAGEKELFAAHVSLKEETIEMLDEVKKLNWNIDGESFIKGAKMLKSKNVVPDKVLKIIKDAGFENVKDFFSYTPEDIFDIVTATKKIDPFVPIFAMRRDKQGFSDGLKKWMTTILQEDSSGLLGFKLNSTGKIRNIPVPMNKIGPMDEQAFTAYCKKFMEDVFLEENIESEMNVLSNTRVIGGIPDIENAKFRIGIEIPSDVALYADAAKTVHIPIKHLAFIEYVNS